MKIVKDSAKTDKIDPIIATIIALSCATLQKPVDENPYEKRGLICV
jgi:phage terminase large subunit-like protein